MTKCPHCEKHILNVYEQSAYNLVKKTGIIKTDKYAKLQNVSLQQANNILKKLTDNGLLKRKQLIQESGGVVYEYTLHTKCG